MNFSFQFAVKIMHSGQGLQHPSKEPDIKIPPDEETLSQSCDEARNSEEHSQTSQQLNQPSTSHLIPHDFQPQNIQPGHFQFGTLQYQPFMPAPGSQSMMIPGSAMGSPAVRMPHYSYMSMEDFKNQQGNYQVAGGGSSTTTSTRKARSSYTFQQLQQLNRRFQRSMYLAQHERGELAAMVGLSQTQVHSCSHIISLGLPL
ncbi:homeobox protein DLL homolog [Macrobrachium nipponense]|uniref:homeobox protein DLL homolog n=1 Tax=Macrobrachium nipponense TaxID=159736 RepID=UPI0030C7C279